MSFSSRSESPIHAPLTLCVYAIYDIQKEGRKREKERERERERKRERESSRARQRDLSVYSSMHRSVNLSPKISG
jgi:hypothetical protein